MSISKPLLTADPSKHTPTEQAVYHRAQELGGVDLLCARFQRQSFSRHTHAGYTVGVIEAGAQQFYRTGDTHIAPRHSIILVNAEQVHTGSKAADEGWSYRALYPLPEQFAQFCHGDAPYFANAVVEDKPLAKLLNHCFTVLEHSDNKLLRESMLINSLQQLVKRHGRTGLTFTGAHASNKLLMVKDFLDEQPEVNISLEELAVMAELSPHHFLRVFQKRFELSPHAYQIQSRLRKAKFLMRGGKPLLEVAQACGFYDQSHMHRHFKRAMGIAPGQFLRRSRNIVQA